MDDQITGTLYLISSEETETAFALGFDQYLEKLNSASEVRNIKKWSSASPSPLMEATFYYLEFLPPTTSIREDGLREWIFTLERNSWLKYLVQPFLEYLTSVGMGIDARFIEADKSVTRFQSTYGSHVLDDEFPADLPKSRIKALEQSEETLRAIRFLWETSLEPEELKSRLDELFNSDK